MFNHKSSESSNCVSSHLCGMVLDLTSKFVKSLSVDGLDESWTE